MFSGISEKGNLEGIKWIEDVFLGKSILSRKLLESSYSFSQLHFTFLKHPSQ